MKTVNRAALMVAASIFILPLSARSEIRAQSFELTPFVGYNFFEEDQNLEDKPLWGGRVGYNFTKNFGVEGVVEFINSQVDDRTIMGAEEGQYRSPMDDVDLVYYHIDAVYHFMPDNAFTPFVVAGFGGAHYSPDISTHDMAAFNLGAGAKYRLTDNVAFRMDVRDYIVTEIFQETYHNIGVTAGVTFSFGGQEKPEPAKVERYEEQPEAVIAPTPVPEVIVLAFEDIYFDFDKSTLTNEAQALLKKNIRILQENPNTAIRISGYTSAAGSDAYNRKLSERRANAVKEYLVNEGGMASDRFVTIGYGETKPLIHETAPKDINSPAAKANMRVLFEIIVR